LLRDGLFKLVEHTGHIRHLGLLALEKLIDALFPLSHHLLHTLDLLLLAVHLLVEHPDQLVLLDQLLLNFFIVAVRIHTFYFLFENTKPLIDICSYIELGVFD
jgi:hypothetical protein